MVSPLEPGLIDSGDEKLTPPVWGRTYFSTDGSTNIYPTVHALAMWHWLSSPQSCGFPFPTEYGWVCDYRGSDAVWLPRLNQKKEDIASACISLLGTLALGVLTLCCEKAQGSPCRDHTEWPGWRGNKGPPLNSQRQLSDAWVNEPSGGSRLLPSSISLEPQTSQGRDKLSPLCPICIYNPQNLWS